MSGLTPAASSPPPPATRLTILFVDAVASTELCEELRDAGARAPVGPRLEDLHDLIERRAGTAVESLGDGILASSHPA